MGRKMQTLKISLLVFILSVTISAQEGWFWQNPYPTGNNLQSLHFIDNQTGWIVGAYGTIFKTTDGGESWALQSSSTTNFLNSIYFTNDQTGWVVGESGTLLKTTNGFDF